MKNVVRCLAATAALVLALPVSGFAQAKVKVAIWEFENHAETNWWFFRDMGPAARNQIDTEFSESKQLSDKFSVVERDKLNLVMKEQNLGASGAVDPASAAKVGKILGVKYIILGGIDKFNIDNTRGGFRGIGGNVRQANATISMRWIDSTTAERVLAISADADSKSGGGFIPGASGGRDAEWGLANKTIQSAAKAVVAKLLTGDYLARIGTASNPTGTVEGMIIKVEANKAWINLGGEGGIKVGDKFSVFNVGEALIDPATGAKLGADEKHTGDGAVTEVQPKYAIITFTGKAAAKDTVRRQ